MTSKAIALPAEADGCDVLCSVSGGKDSTALMLACREAEIPFVAVFADTGWEAAQTYAYLDLLRKEIGPIETVRPARDMVASIRHRAGFPARMQRWCTRELKIEPLRAFHDAHEERTGRETVCAMGVRAEESAARALMAVFEDEPAGSRGWGGFMWRPLLTWTIDDVIDIHKRHGVPMNPLYHLGFDRVGCFPCIFARKEEIRRLDEVAPERVKEIALLEEETTALRASRNAADPGRYKHLRGSFFQTRDRANDGAMPIREVVAWSKTERGGRQFPILQPLPSGGCMRWGTCEAPPAGEDETVAAVRS